MVNFEGLDYNTPYDKVELKDFDEDYNYCEQCIDEVIVAVDNFCALLDLVHKYRTPKVYFNLRINRDTDDVVISLAKAIIAEIKNLSRVFDRLTRCVRVVLLPSKWLDLYIEKINNSFDYLKPDGIDHCEGVLGEAMEALDSLFFGPDDISDAYFDYTEYTEYYDTINKEWLMEGNDAVNPAWFDWLLGRYEREFVKKLDMYMEDVADVKVAKRELKKEFGEYEGVRCWIEAGGDVEKTIKLMAYKRCVERDLLPLLEYKAKCDRLTALEKGYVRPAVEVGGKPSRGAGKPKATLFKDEAVKNRESERVREYLSACNLQGTKWTSRKDDSRTKVALCFAQCWSKRGMIAEDFSGKALVDFMIDCCGLTTEVDRKALATKINGRKGEKCDPEVLKLVGAKFKND